MKVSYKYRGVSFILPFDAWCKLMWITLRLHFQRLCRLIKRVCLSMKPLILVIIIAIFFSFLTGFIGVAIAKYTIWYETIWDLRLFYCTSIIISATSFAVSSQQKHHQKLKEQENEYFEFLYLSDHFMRDSLNLLGVNVTVNFFMTSELYSEASDQIKDVATVLSKKDLLNSHPSPAEFREQATPTDSLLFYLNEFLRIIENTKKYTYRLVNESDSYSFSSYCTDAGQMLREEIFLIQSSTKNHTPIFSVNVLDFMERISGQIFLIAASLRRPWRYEPDWSLDNTQRNILSTCGDIVGETYNPLEYWK